MTQFKDNTFDDDMRKLKESVNQLWESSRNEIRGLFQSAINDLDAGKSLEFDAERIKAELRKIKEAKDESV